MSDEHDDPPTRTAAGARRWRDLASSAFLLGVVAIILLVGFALRTAPSHERQVARIPSLPAALAPEHPGRLPRIAEPDEAASEPRSVDSPVVAGPRPVPPPEPASPPESDEPLAALAQRAARDVTRLTESRQRYTAQILVACQPESVTRALRRAQGARALYVLPAEVDGRACFRLCWSTYARLADAAAAKDLPPALRGESVRAVEIAKVLP